MRLPCLSLLVSFLVLTSLPAAPGSSGKPGPSDHWTPQDVISTETAGSFQISPDGRWAVWVKTTLDADHEEHVAQLMRTDLQGGRTIELTRGSHSCLHPRWSPDGKHIAFLSDRPAAENKPAKRRRPARKARTEDREEKKQLWLMDPFGGEPWRLTDWSREIKGFDWAGDDSLVFVAQESASHRETALKDDRKDSTNVVEDEKHEPPVRLFRVTVEDRTITRLSENHDRIETLAVSPDGQSAVAIHSRSLRYVYDNKIKPAVYLYDLQTGKHRRLFEDRNFNIGAIRWTPNSKGFYATNEHSSQPQLNIAGITELYYHDRNGDRPVKVDLQWERGLAVQVENDEQPGVEATRDGFVALLANGVRGKTARYTRNGQGWKREWLAGDKAERLHGLQVSANSKVLLFAHSTASQPTQWYRADLKGAQLSQVRAITELNEHLDELPKARSEVVRWKGALGEEVEGILFYPHGYQEGRKYPLLVQIHGGPMMADLDSWDDSWAYPANLYCQRGAFVLRPNYHGSSNYGLAWVESITRGKYLDLETEDVEKGVDALVARGLVDAGRLGLMGWSNGGILTNALTVRTTRYKAAVSGAGTVEYVSDWASCEFGEAFDRFYLGRSPLEDPKLYHNKSPFFQLDRVRTPTLIFFGSEDRTVPTQQGWILYRGLQQLGKTDVRLVLFPGEEHSLKKPAHQRRKLEEELAWFDRHLFGSFQYKNEALKHDSPLAWALQRSQAQRSAGKLGILKKGVLVPETVEYKQRTVGRFEVTVAQYRQFDPQYRQGETLADNLPAAGITFEQAQVYCAWLSRKTGRVYRLPDEDDAVALYEESEAGENTLDHWAGYAVNPDDAARLQEMIKELPGRAPLLREVGQFRGSGEEKLVFDLGGNVAEWTVDEDGKGALYGGSADTPANPRAKTSPAGAEYRGFRVVLEGK